MAYTKLRKYIILAAIFLLVLILGCAKQTPQTQESKPIGSQASEKQETQKQIAQEPSQPKPFSQPQTSQPFEAPEQAVPPPIEYAKVTNETPTSTLEEECGKKTWPEYCTWIPEPDGRVLCEKCKELGK